MVSLFLMTPKEIGLLIAAHARQKRLDTNSSQKSLSERSGVSLSVIKKFEQTGKISFESLIKIALTLNALDTFEGLFKSEKQWENLDALLRTHQRKRGRQ